MPEEIDVDTKDLQDTIEELHEERKEREETERRTAWTRYIALTTAILAVFAAIAALRAGTLVNEAVLRQLKASDKWNEYQADRTKDHLYSIQAHQLLDRGVKPPPAETDPAAVGEHGAKRGHGAPAEGGAASGEPPAPKKHSEDSLKPLSPGERLAGYVEQVRNERSKEEKLADEARDLEKDSAADWHVHEQFAIAVALIQVAIALGAVAALTRIKPVWALSLVVGVIGIYFFANGWLAH